MNKFETFANLYGKFAVNASKKFGISPEIILAVAAHETGFGTSTSSQVDNNFFGLSVGSFKSPYWDGISKRKTSDTAGYYRQYQDPQNSFYDFGYLLSNASRYAAVMRAKTDLYGFVAAFINSGYFTGNKTVYANALLDYAPKLKPYIKSGFNWLLIAGFGFFVIINKNRNGN